MTAPIRPALLSLLGPSDSGKTTLAVILVDRWTRAGRRVGYLKHASHGFEMDRPGKDTARALAAGGVGVAVTGPEGTAYLDRARVRDPRELVARFFPACDVCVLEGFRDAALPAVVIAGPEGEAAYLDEARGELLAVLAAPDSAAARAAEERRVPCFGTDAVEDLVRRLEDRLAIHG